jgi:leader peptidase (prepilin peptidase)/N-methyltransferase
MTIMVGSLLGSIVGITLIGMHVIKREDYIPFGPFLVCGAVVALFFGDPIFEWYQGLLSQ